MCCCGRINDFHGVSPVIVGAEICHRSDANALLIIKGSLI